MTPNIKERDGKNREFRDGFSKKESRLLQEKFLFFANFAAQAKGYVKENVACEKFGVYPEWVFPELYLLVDNKFSIMTSKYLTKEGRHCRGEKKNRYLLLERNWIIVSLSEQSNRQFIIINTRFLVGVSLKQCLILRSPFFFFHKADLTRIDPSFTDLVKFFKLMVRIVPYLLKSKKVRDT